MKKAFCLVIVALFVLTVFPVAAAAEENADAATAGIVVTDETINPEDPLLFVVVPERVVRANAENDVENGEEGTPSDPADATDVIPSDAEPADGEEPDGPAEYVISGSNIPVINGVYNYKLVIIPPDKLLFDNDLENLYQGVKGKYKLHYEIDELDNHIMVVTGVFDNIITESPLLILYRDSITGDTYSYQLDLRTKEGFTFTNHLQYQINDVQHGFSVHIDYDLSTNQLKVDVEKLQDEEENTVFRPLKKLLEKIQSLFSRLFACFKK